MRYRIGEVAELFGLTKGGVRFLEKKGVIRSFRDDRNGYRYYERDQITDIKQLRSFQAMGFSLEEAMDLMRSDPDQVLSSIERKERRLIDQIEQTRRMIDALKKQKSRIAAAKPAAGAVWTVSPRPALFRISVWEDLIRQGALPEKTDPKTERERKAAEAAFISHMPEVALSLLMRKTEQGFLIARGSCVEQEDAAG